MTVLVEQLARSFGAIEAVKGIDLEVGRGETFGFLGPNGAGKSTTIKMLCTLLHPSSGRAWINGHDIEHEASLVRQSIGIVFQDPTLVVATFVTALAIAGLGVVIAMWITDFENFGTIQNFITLPLYMFSGAIFPTRAVPSWLHVVLLLNPLSYGVNAIRGVLLGYDIAHVPFNLAVLLVFTVVMLMIAIWMSRREV